MIYISTRFHNERIAEAQIFNGHNTQIIPIFKAGSGISLYNALERYKIINQIINDPKRSIYFDNPELIYGLSDITYHDNHHTYAPKQNNDALNVGELQRYPPGDWSALLAKTASTYSRLFKRGIFMDGHSIHPTFSFTSTGRLRLFEHPIQSLDHNYAIQANLNHDVFVNFDWIAADFRILGLLSEDQTLLNTYNTGDVYTYLAKAAKISRTQAKRELLKALYNLDIQHPFIQHFAGCHKWMINQLRSIDEHTYSESILKRRFYYTGNIRSTFNAIIQGSIAHAMQSAVIKIFTKFPHNFIIDLHDSVVLSCTKSELLDIIKTVSNIMYRPLVDYGIDATFPFTINIGQRWRDWSLWKIKR